LLLLPKLADLKEEGPQNPLSPSLGFLSKVNPSKLWFITIDSPKDNAEAQPTESSLSTTNKGLIYLNINTLPWKFVPIFLVRVLVHITGGRKDFGAHKAGGILQTMHFHGSTLEVERHSPKNHVTHGYQIYIFSWSGALQIFTLFRF